MLATLYDLEIVEDVSVRDWMQPPDNRHEFLKQAKDRYALGLGFSMAWLERPGNQMKGPEET